MQGQVSTKWTSGCEVWIKNSISKSHSLAPLGKPCDARAVALSMDIKNVYTSPMKLIFMVPKMEKINIANSVDPDEVAHNEPPHLDLHCLPSKSFNF